MAISSQAETGPLREFRIGNVISRSLSVYTGHFLVFFLVGMIPALPRLIWYPDPKVPSLTAGLFLILATFVLSPICQATLLYGAFQAMRGRPVDLGESVSKGLGRIVPIIGLAICSGVLISLGMLLLIVPGVMIALALYVALPICVVEQRGVFDSMRRSAELTKGLRWQLLGLALIVFLATIILSGIAAALLHVIGGTFLARIGSFLAYAIVGAFGAIMAVVTYNDLRAAKEGIDTDRIIAVFD